MAEPQPRPVQSPARGRVTCEHDPALWRTAQLRYRDYLTQGGGIFFVGIPPDPDSPEASMWRRSWTSEVVVLPPGTYGYRELESIGLDRSRSAPTISTDVRLHWETVPSDSLDDWKTMSWPQAATALLAPARLLHGWEPQWERAASATVAGRPGTRVPLVLTLPWSDERSYGDSLQPHWMDLYTETAEVVIDDERGVILEWNGLVDDQVFEHNAFTAIDFDVPLTDRDFDPVSLGPTKRTT